MTKTEIEKQISDLDKQLDDIENTPDYTALKKSYEKAVKNLEVETVNFRTKKKVLDDGFKKAMTAYREFGKKYQESIREIKDIREKASNESTRASNMVKKVSDKNQPKINALIKKKIPLEKALQKALKSPAKG